MRNSLLILVSLFSVFAVPAAQAAARDAASIVEALAEGRFDRLGHPQIKTDSIHPVTSSARRPHRLLVLPVRFPDVGFDRFKGEARADRKNQRYLQKLLFSRNMTRPTLKTMTHYFHHQSRGRYVLTGKVFDPVSVSKPLADYGRPIRTSDGNWRNDSGAEGLVEEALRLAYKSKPNFPWADYDIWDPTDFDGDGERDEPDGYIDHFVLVYAGKGQSSCHGLHKLAEKFTPNAPENLIDTLTEDERACADRLWPHRFSLTKNNGRGPVIEGFMNRRGGIEVGPGLWVYDYNMQSEYTTVSTFIHEFGHSLGLPDIYARKTNNSTASWEVMSSTAGIYPQEMSAWSRMVLGWLSPCVIRPTEFGGGKVQSVYLKTMNDWSGKADEQLSKGLCDAAMVVLPPKTREIALAGFENKHGKAAAYSGQGNDMNRFLSRGFDLTQAKGKPILEFDTWFEIEGDWDYLYLTASTDGENYTRLMPTDKQSVDDSDSVMPSKKGHDGKGTIPGFTGRSGDLNADGKVESAPNCDPSKPKVLAEDRVGGGKDPCEVAQWVHAAFDLSPYKGKKVEIRFHYFTDGAAVENGALIDNVELKAIDYRHDFEQGFEGWTVDGFSLSSGKHVLPVPHYYLLEYRDPWTDFKDVFNYDSTLRREALSFHDGKGGAFAARYRPGVVLWYANGEYLWSQNEPAQFGTGNGFLLVVDSTPQEYRYPGVPEQFYKTENDRTFYKLDDSAQAALEKGFLDVMCHQRRPDYFPSDIPEAKRKACEQSDGVPPVENMEFEGKKLIYGYTLGNEFLPGPPREPYKGVSTLYDIKLRKGKLSYRLYDRRLRNFHSADAPFSLERFERGLVFYKRERDTLVESDSRAFEPVSVFDDSDPATYLNPGLRFGSAKVPREGLSFQLAKPKPDAPDGARVKVYFTWSR